MKCKYYEDVTLLRLTLRGTVGLTNDRGQGGLLFLPTVAEWL